MDLSERIAALSPSKRALLELRLKKQGVEFNSYPLSFAQTRLWFLDQLSLGNPLYNMAVAVRLEGHLNITALHKSFKEIVRRHETLRTAFAVINGRPTQVVSPSGSVEMPIIDLTDLPAAFRETKAQGLIAEESNAKFNLSLAPLLRVGLLRIAAEYHVLLLTMHHIISDGWSMGILIQEMSALYDTYCADKESPLAELTIQYSDYAVWQQRHLQGEVLEELLGYWKRQLADPPTPTLPTDRTCPVVYTFRGSSKKFVFSKSLRERLREIEQKERASLYMILSAAFQALLYRYTGEKDLLIGTPTANRNRAEAEELIGFFVNTLVMRTKFEDDMTFRELSARVKQTALEAYAHQDLPFERLVEELQPDRNLSSNPIFRVMFSLQNAVEVVPKLTGLKVSIIETECRTAKFDLAVDMAVAGEEIKGAFIYSTDLFNDGTIERMIGHYRTLLSEVIENPDRSIAELSYLTAAEKRQLEVEWNATEARYRSEGSLVELIEAQVNDSPNHPAILCGEQSLSYRELNERANRIGRYLKGKGVGREEVAGVCLERGVEMIAALLGIWKAGAAYLPLDPEHPEQRLRGQAADAGVRYLLRTRRGGPSWGQEGVEEIYLDEVEAECEGESGGNLEVEVRGGDLAYLIYTSGTTGEPKGVMVEHGNLRNVILGSCAAFGFGQGEVMGCLAGYGFDIFLFEVMKMLVSGGTSLLLKGEEVRDVERLAEKVAGMSAVHAVPSLMRRLTEEIRRKGKREKYWGVKQVFVGGDAVPEELIEQLKKVFENGRINILYGPTEATIISTRYEARREEPMRGRQIGRPLGNVKVRISDERGGLVAIGVSGEIWIGGAGVSRG